MRLSHSHSAFPVVAAIFTLLIAVGAFASATDGAAAESPTAEYSYSLFDGKTLNGWTVENECEAAVQDGMLLLKSGNGWLRSDHQYTDFRLHVEWKALQAANYDAGIYLRTLPGGSPFAKQGYQANLLQGKEGNIGNLSGASSSGLIKPPGEWNSFDFTVVGETVALVINDQPAYKVGGLTIPVGHVGLQVEVPKGGQFLIRNVRITELAFETLFSETDLTHWEGAGQPADQCWQVVDGLLQCSGAHGPWLRSQREFDDFSLRFEYLVAPGGNSGVYVRVPSNGNHHRDNDTLPPAGFEVQILDDAAEKYADLKDYQFCGSVYAIAPATRRVGKPAGEWNSMEINCKGQHVTTIHNGIVTVSATPDLFPNLALRQQKGHLGLQNHSTVVKFRRLRIGPAVDYPAP